MGAPPDAGFAHGWDGIVPLPVRRAARFNPGDALRYA
jgi:hypothetical protein